VNRTRIRPSSYIVHDGEVWRAGPHMLRCGDMMTPAGRAWLDAVQPDVVYCDPPWGPGNHTYWWTLAGRDGYPVGRNYDATLRAVASIARTARLGDPLALP
jgi:hypothetical protein